MDCRHALRILDFTGAVPAALDRELWSSAEVAAAESHLESCAACNSIVRAHRELDQSIARVMQAVPIPRGAQQRLLKEIAKLETSEIGAGSAHEPFSLSADGDLATTVASDGDMKGAVVGSSSGSATPSGRRLSRRRLLRTIVPVAACLVVAAVGFFGVVWLMLPSLSVEEISRELTKIDFKDLENLGEFRGNEAVAHLPSEPGWQRLEWACGRKAKALLASNSIAVYGFVVPETRRHAAIRGLIAVVPRSRRIRSKQIADSLANASAASDYLAARIGESVSVAWRQGDVVCVCLIQGGADSLATLQGLVEEPSA